MEKRQAIIDALIARLQTIRITNGYYTELGANVFAYRTTPIQDDELPAANVTDGDESKGDQFTGNSPVLNRILDVSIDILLKEGDMSINAARRGIIDCEKAIGSDIYFGGLAFYTDFISSNIVLDQKTNVVAGAKLMIRVTYRTTKWAES